MTEKPGIAVRLQFLVRVVRKDCQHLANNDQSLLSHAFTLALPSRLEANPGLTKRVGTFMARFRTGMTLWAANLFPCFRSLTV